MPPLQVSILLHSLFRSSHHSAISQCPKVILVVSCNVPGIYQLRPCRWLVPPAPQCLRLVAPTNGVMVVKRVHGPWLSHNQPHLISHLPLINCSLLFTRRSSKSWLHWLLFPPIPFTLFLGLLLLLLPISCCSYHPLLVLHCLGSCYIQVCCCVC